jgi:hypothetical protein
MKTLFSLLLLAACAHRPQTNPDSVPAEEETVSVATTLEHIYQSYVLGCVEALKKTGKKNVLAGCQVPAREHADGVRKMLDLPPRQEPPREEWAFINSPSDWYMFVGRWYGRVDTLPGGPVQWIIDRKESGKYSVTYQTLLPTKKIKIEHFEGHWGADEAYYFTSANFQVVKGKRIPLMKDNKRDYFYTVLKRTPDRIDFRDLGQTFFSVKRVGPEFRFPSMVEH